MYSISKIMKTASNKKALIYTQSNKMFLWYNKNFEKKKLTEKIAFFLKKIDFLDFDYISKYI